MISLSAHIMFFMIVILTGISQPVRDTPPASGEEPKMEEPEDKDKTTPSEPVL